MIYEWARVKTRKRECFSSSSSSSLKKSKLTIEWPEWERICSGRTGRKIVETMSSSSSAATERIIFRRLWTVNCIVSGHYHCARCCLFCVFIQMANESKAHLLLYFLVMRQRRRRQLHASNVQCCTVDSGSVIWCSRRRRRIVLQALVKHTHTLYDTSSFSFSAGKSWKEH